MSDKAVVLSAAVTLMFSVGCSPDFVRFDGVVTHKGKPVPYLQIVLSPVDPELVRPPISMSDKEGKFRMTTGTIVGVKRGEYYVFIDDPEREGGGQTSTEEDYLYVTKKYAPNVSELKIDVQRHMSNYELQLE